MKAVVFSILALISRFLKFLALLWFLIELIICIVDHDTFNWKSFGAFIALWIIHFIIRIIAKVYIAREVIEDKGKKKSSFQERLEARAKRHNNII